MTRTKQTKRGSSSSRPTGMATARFGNEGDDSQFKDIPEEEWPDMDKPPPQAVETSEAKNQHLNTASRKTTPPTMRKASLTSQKRLQGNIQKIKYS